MKAVLHYRASEGFRRLLRETCPADVQIAVVDEADDQAFAREMKEADALLHVLRPVRAADMEGAPRLRLIQKVGVGVNTIDLEAAKRLGIAVRNMPGTNSHAVAEMTLMLMLATLRRTSYFDPLTRRGEGWRPDTAELDRVGEIAGRTIGFVGYGAVPSRLAPVLHALGAHILFTARAPKTDAAARFATLDDLLARADIVSLHCPATPETRGMISREAMARMKQGAVLINTARGELVDEAALADALRCGHLRAAGLDVFAREPAEGANPLFALPNVVLMPHVAWLTPETLERSMTVAFENCFRVMRGEQLLHRVA